MKSIITNLFILFLANSLCAQKGLINNGAYIKIEPGAKVYVDGNADGDLSISSTGSLDLGGWLTVEGEIMNNGTMTLDTSASLIDGGLSTGYGVTNFKKYIDGQYSLFSIPVSGLIAGNVTEFALEKWNENDSSWVELNPSDNLLKMVGYSPTMAFGNSKVIAEFSGSLYTGNNTVALQSVTNGFNLIGNPYPSGINWNAIAQFNNDIDKALYFWNGHNYSYYLANSSLSINGGNSFIQPASGFFVKANATGSLEVSNSMRVHNAEDIPPISGSLGDYLLISVSNGTYTDETLINFVSGASSGYDSDFDAIKLHSPISSVPQVYSSYQDHEYAINSLPTNEMTIEMSLNFKADTDGDFQFQFIDYKLDNIENISIIDSKFSDEPREIFKNNDWLPDSPSWPFDYSTSDNINRFTLVFNNSVTSVHQNMVNNTWKVYSNNKTVYVDIDFAGNDYASIKIYNTLGELVYKDKAFKGLNSFHLTQYSPGIYYVNTIINGSPLTQKILLH
ncbi:MAG: T9SS type A sorting domain-containing protein [Bacteroidales bacterium]|nr:T9SS type A sorting domain-containing protein [Bacteroidales bacterium]